MKVRLNDAALHVTGKLDHVFLPTSADPYISHLYLNQFPKKQNEVNTPKILQYPSTQTLSEGEKVY